MASFPARNNITLYPVVPSSYRDLVEMMSERGLAVHHTTIFRWVQKYARIVQKLDLRV